MISLTLWGLLMAALLGFWRVVAGPTVPDRIVAADTVGTIFTTLLAVLALFFENPVFLNIALAFAVLSFADVLIMAKYFEHGELYK
ncbi:MAG TPA: monovalent cation/H+ antiporter complex subunit F [Synergistaceae bacterium]|nr:monovalent cation/H+ antiporter complex subunit F [Synergistaceae bacterium]